MSLYLCRRFVKKNCYPEEKSKDQILTCVASMVLPPAKALAMAMLSRMEIRGMMMIPSPTLDIISLK